MPIGLGGEPGEDCVLGEVTDGVGEVGGEVRGDGPECRDSMHRRPQGQRGGERLGGTERSDGHGLGDVGDQVPEGPACFGGGFGRAGGRRLEEQHAEQGRLGQRELQVGLAPQAESFNGVVVVGHSTVLAGAELRPAAFAGFVQQQLAFGPVVIEGRRGAAGLVDDGGNGDPVGAPCRHQLAQGRGQDGPANVHAVARTGQQPRWQPPTRWTARCIGWPGAAAVLALAALMVGGVAMALTSQAGTSTADVLAAIGTNPWPFLAGGIGLVLVSLFDLFTIPALHATLGRYGRVLIVLASAAVVIGDLLGVIGRLAQTALVPIGLQATAGPAGTELLAAGHVLGVLDFTVNTAGFVLVSVSFTCFGLLMLRGFSRPIGWIAIVAGVFTLLGQVPAPQPLFMVADVAYIAWYIGIGRRFWRMAYLDA